MCVLLAEEDVAKSKVVEESRKEERGRVRVLRDAHGNPIDIDL